MEIIVAMHLAMFFDKRCIFSHMNGCIVLLFIENFEKGPLHFSKYKIYIKYKYNYVERYWKIKKVCLWVSNDEVIVLYFIVNDFNYFHFLFKIIKSIFSHNKFKSFAAFDSNHYSCRYFKKAGNNPIKDNDLPLL